MTSRSRRICHRERRRSSSDGGGPVERIDRSLRSQSQIAGSPGRRGGSADALALSLEACADRLLEAAKVLGVGPVPRPLPVGRVELPGAPLRLVVQGLNDVRVDQLGAGQTADADPVWKSVLLGVSAAVPALHLHEDPGTRDAADHAGTELRPSGPRGDFDCDGVAGCECCELLGAEPVLDCHVLRLSRCAVAIGGKRPRLGYEASAIAPPGARDDGRGRGACRQPYFAPASASCVSNCAARKNLFFPRSPTVLMLNACLSRSASPSLTPCKALTGAFRISAKVLFSHSLSRNGSRFASTAMSAPSRMSSRSSEHRSVRPSAPVESDPAEQPRRHP